MKRVFPLFLWISLLAAPFSSAQNAAGITLDPSDVEEIKRLIGTVADLQEMIQAQNLKIANMKLEIETLHGDLREAQEKNSRKLADAVTREDLKKLGDSIKEVDEKRMTDNKQMLDAIEKMLKESVKPPSFTGSGNTPPDKPDKPVKPPRDLSSQKQSTNTTNEMVYTYEVAKGDNLSLIISEYNKAIKEKEPNKASITLDMVRRANPSINLNNIYVGQKILIPVPPDKK